MLKKTVMSTTKVVARLLFVPKQFSSRFQFLYVFSQFAFNYLSSPQGWTTKPQRTSGYMWTRDARAAENRHSVGLVALPWEPEGSELVLAIGICYQNCCQSASRSTLTWKERRCIPIYCENRFLHKRSGKKGHWLTHPGGAVSCSKPNVSIKGWQMDDFVFYLNRFIHWLPNRSLPFTSPLLLSHTLALPVEMESVDCNNSLSITCFLLDSFTNAEWQQI